MKCDAQAVFRYTWPGKAESFICAGHAPKLRKIAEAIGCPVEFILLGAVEMEGKLCRQEVEKKPTS